MTCPFKAYDRNTCDEKCMLHVNGTCAIVGLLADKVLKASAKESVSVVAKKAKK